MEALPEPSESSLQEVRKRLLRLVRQKGKRVIGRPPDRPSKWRPAEVKQADGLGFTEPGAWDWIVELLVEGCELKPVSLNKPPGRTAYSIIADYCQQRVYIKLEIADGDRLVYARSFHLSDPPSR